NLVQEVFDTSHDVFDWVKKEEKQLKKKHKWLRNLSGMVHFVLLTSILFIILLLISNWSAYSTFAGAYLAPEKLANEQKTIEGGLQKIEVTNISTNEEEIKQMKIQRILKRRLEKNNTPTQTLGVDYFDQEVSSVTLSVNVTPYEDRIIIPKIGKNIPLINVEQHDASNSTEWHKIFMKELENGIVKYPGSADPGEKGNSFIFGHSSNYPWAKGNYNDVFALLNELENGDEIIVYFKHKKFVYAVKDKKVVKPGHVSSLGGTEEMKQLTLMTCWPLGTTISRLLIVTELKEITNTI
ncbi:sortase, partial [Candidatus Gracilibacteria bacterium]|nr:sortase [Candidatus Gracilibacteria bacterium]